jgi:3-dehydrosphinganine reductase
MGKSVAKQLAAKGANIVIVSRSTAKLELALAEVKVGACILELPVGANGD